MPVALRGEFARAQRDDSRAALWLQEGLGRYRAQGDPVGMAGCLAGLATIATSHGDDARAAHLFAAAGKLGEGATGFLPPTDRSDYDAALAVVRDRLGDAAYAASMGFGYAMPIEHVLAEAALVDGRGPRQRTRPIPASKVPTAKELGLTDDQYEVLRLLGRGLTVKEIADHLYRDDKSIYGRADRIKRHLHLSSIGHLIAFAKDHDLR